MAYHIKDSDTDRIIRELAKVTGKPILNAIRDACEKELRREVAKVPLWDRLQPLIDKVRATPKTGLRADKRFFDDLSGQP
jgi:antitoxin VapB